MKPILQPILFGACLAVGFLFMASVFAPDYSHARPQPELSPSAPSTDPLLGLPLLGTVFDDEFQIQIHAGNSGPLSVFDHEGARLGELMTAEQLADRFPDLDVNAMEFGTEGPVMMADSVWPDV